MNTLNRRLGAGIAAVLTADALLHLDWVLWPVADERALSLALLNMVVPFTPRGLLPLVALLLTAATLVLVRAWAVGPAWLRRLAYAATCALALGLAARSALGLIWATGLGVAEPGPFLWLNRIVYTPLCLALLAATVPLLDQLKVRSARG